MWERFVNVRGMLASIPTHRSSAPRQPDQHLHDRTPWRTQPFQTSRVALPLPQGEGWGEGEGITLSFTACFSAFGSGLNSTENGEEPIKAHRALAWLQLPILLQNLFVTELVESVCAKS